MSARQRNAAARDSSLRRALPAYTSTCAARSISRVRGRAAPKHCRGGHVPGWNRLEWRLTRASSRSRAPSASCGATTCDTGQLEQGCSRARGRNEQHQLPPLVPDFPDPTRPAAHRPARATRALQPHEQGAPASARAHLDDVGAKAEVPLDGAMLKQRRLLLHGCIPRSGFTKLCCLSKCSGGRPLCALWDQRGGLRKGPTRGHVTEMGVHAQDRACRVDDDVTVLQLSTTDCS